MPAPRIAPVRLGEKGIVVVAGVGRIDGDQPQIAQIGTLAQRRRLGGFGLGQGLTVEAVGDAVVVDGDQADRPRVGEIAEALDDAGPLGAEAAAAALDVGQHQSAVLGPTVLAGRDPELALDLAIGGDDAAALGAAFVKPQNALGGRRQGADDAGGVEGAVGVALGLEADQRPLARTEGPAAPALHFDDIDPRRRRLALPAFRRRHQVAVFIGAGDAHNHDRGQPIGRV